MHIDRIDHFVLTVRDIEATCAFYRTGAGKPPPFQAGDESALPLLGLGLWGIRRIVPREIGIDGPWDQFGYRDPLLLRSSPQALFLSVG